MHSSASRVFVGEKAVGGNVIEGMKIPKISKGLKNPTYILDGIDYSKEQRTRAAEGTGE